MAAQGGGGEDIGRLTKGPPGRGLAGTGRHWRQEGRRRL
jgi:hypothetical protein